MYHHDRQPNLYNNKDEQVIKIQTFGNIEEHEACSKRTFIPLLAIAGCEVREGLIVGG